VVAAGAAPPVIAHILAPGNVPGVVPWITAIALYGGLLGIVMSWRSHRRRAIFAALAVAGLVSTAVVYITQPSLPPQPGYGITLDGLDGRTTSSPVAVRVCATAPVPGPGRLLLVRVDGAQAAETRDSTVVLLMSTGRHRIDAELITADHRAFQPPVAATAMVVVSGSGPLTAAPPCG
jgi:hypothetical protein